MLGRLLHWPHDRDVLGRRGERSRGQNRPPVIQPWSESAPVIQPGLETALAAGMLSMCFHMNMEFRNFRSRVSQKTLPPLSDPCNLSFPEASLDSCCSVCKIIDSLNHGIHFCFNHVIFKLFWNCHVSKGKREIRVFSCSLVTTHSLTHSLVQLGDSCWSPV